MKKLLPIPVDEARKDHGITCEHTRTENDGELRFRLRKDDGTAYIRTEAREGGWQDSDWHDKVLETYIVQSGWIGYAESKGGEPELYIYRAGESFTTQPHVIHNVYLPARSVIHTVKHGEARGEDRLEDDQTREFTDRVSRISDRELLERGTRAPARIVIPPAAGRQHAEAYSPAYMHFDSLIWQVPAWATGIFAIVFAGMTQLQSTPAPAGSEPSSTLVELVGLNATGLLAVTALMFGLMLTVLSYALYRFRWHQIGAKEYTPRRPHFSPQVFLQLIVNVQAVVLLLLSVAGFGAKVSLSVSGVIVAFIIFTLWQESTLIRRGREAGKPEKTAS